MTAAPAPVRQNGSTTCLTARNLGTDPDDRALLKLAASSNRVTITIDTDLGELICWHNFHHAGLLRLLDLPAE